MKTYVKKSVNRGRGMAQGNEGHLMLVVERDSKDEIRETTSHSRDKAQNWVMHCLSCT
jgi:hypothetical protein